MKDNRQSKIDNFDAMMKRYNNRMKQDNKMELINNDILSEQSHTTCESRDYFEALYSSFCSC
eukprot:UN01060